MLFTKYIAVRHWDVDDGGCIHWTITQVAFGILGGIIHATCRMRPNSPNESKPLSPSQLTSP